MGYRRRPSFVLAVVAFVVGCAGTGFAAADAPASKSTPLEKRLAYYRRIYLTDGYDKAGTRDPKWDDSAREAIGHYVKIAADDPTRTRDEEALILAACRKCYDAKCTDPVVFYIAARMSAKTSGEADTDTVINMHVFAASRARVNKDYPPQVRAMIFVRGAYYASQGYHRHPDPKVEGYPRDMMRRGMELVPAAVSEADVPMTATDALFGAIALASREIEGDRLKLLTEATRAAEQTPASKSALLTVTGQSLRSYAWDARGDGWASEVTKEGWRQFGERIAAARTALEAAWKLDPTNGTAAAEMIVIAQAQSLPRDEMETWYKRAVEADPSLTDAVKYKMEYLAPKWHGSLAEQLAFGRQLLEDGRWDVCQPLQLVEFHMEQVWYEDEGEDYWTKGANYFKKRPDAWRDVKAVYDEYLKRVPESRYHRTRYAMLAAWSGEWAEADRQFKTLGDAYARTFPDSMYRALRDRAAVEVGGGATPKP